MDLIFYTVVILLAFVALITDLRALKIPNVIPVLILGLFLVRVARTVFFEEQIWSVFQENFIVGGAMFLITFLLFAIGLFGAGDAKLITALSFWLGFNEVIHFILFTALFGGVLGLCGLILMKSGLSKKFPKGWLKSLSEGEGRIPYAVAIFFGFVASVI